MKKTHLILLALIAIACVASVYGYANLPDQIATHWNAAGNADGYMSKLWGLGLFPMVMLFLYGLYVGIPKLDPNPENIRSFQKQYDAFWLMMVAMFEYIFFLSLAWNFGYRFNFTLFILPMLAVFFYFIGDLLEHTKPNWFVGIRTPWTLTDPTVWKKTHEQAGKYFKFASFFTLIAICVPSPWNLGVAIIPICLVAMWSIFYSYAEYKKLHH